MRRFAAFVLLLVFSVSFFFLPPQAAACSSGPPELPLRGLYLRSDLIVVGTPQTPTKWIADKVEGEGEDRSKYQYYHRNVPIAIQEVIKGTPPESLTIPESESRYIPGEGEVPAGTIGKDFEKKTYSQIAKTGKQQLFFLTRDKDDGTYAITVNGRYYDPFADDLGLFVTRLRQLHAIYSTGKTPAKEAVLEWLVTMAEDPRTRFEGSFELADILNEDRRVKEKAEKEAAETETDSESKTAKTTATTADRGSDENADGETKSVTIDGLPAGAVVITIPDSNVESSDDEDETDELGYDPYDADESMAAMLTDAQKERLIQAFLTVRFKYETKLIERPQDDDDEEDEEEAPEEYRLPVLTRKDRQLLETIAYFRDRRVTARLIAELPATSAHFPHDASNFIGHIARYFDDEDFDELNDDYSDSDYNDDDEETTDDNDAPITYGQLRADLVQKIVNLSGKLMAKEKQNPRSFQRGMAPMK